MVDGGVGTGVLIVVVAAAGGYWLGGGVQSHVTMSVSPVAAAAPSPVQCGWSRAVELPTRITSCDMLRYRLKTGGARQGCSMDGVRYHSGYTDRVDHRYFNRKTRF